jgi:hypothetical protein
MATVNDLNELQAPTTRYSVDRQSNGCTCFAPGFDLLLPIKSAETGHKLPVLPISMPVPSNNRHHHG